MGPYRRIYPFTKPLKTAFRILTLHVFRNFLMDTFLTIIVMSLLPFLLQVSNNVQREIQLGWVTDDSDFLAERTFWKPLYISLPAFCRCWVAWRAFLWSQVSACVMFSAEPARGRYYGARGAIGARVSCLWPTINLDANANRLLTGRPSLSSWAHESSGNQLCHKIYPSR